MSYFYEKNWAKENNVCTPNRHMHVFCSKYKTKTICDQKKLMIEISDWKELLILSYPFDQVSWDTVKCEARGQGINIGPEVRYTTGSFSFQGNLTPQKSVSINCGEKENIFFWNSNFFLPHKFWNCWKCKSAFNGF